MKVELILAEHSVIVRNLFPYYLYDMSGYTGFSPDATGSFAPAEGVVPLEDYWQLPDHTPYLIHVDGELAGFSLIRPYPSNRDFFEAGQFFVMRKFHHKGVGREAFRLSAEKHPGKWLIRVLPNNSGARKFWEKVLLEISRTPLEIRRELYGDIPMDFLYCTL